MSSITNRKRTFQHAPHPEFIGFSGNIAILVRQCVCHKGTGFIRLASRRILSICSHFGTFLSRKSTMLPKLRMKLSWMIVMMSCILVVKGGLDPCTSYKELSDADRDKRFTQDTGKSDATDLEAGAWYRFTGQAGYKLSNRFKMRACDPVPACGTSSPGFMIGRNPKNVGKVAEKKVCFTEGSDCCAKKVNIKVKRCEGNFLVYELPETPSGTYRYCGQKKKEKPTEAPPTTAPVSPTTTPGIPGEDKDHPGKSCKDIKEKNPQGGSGLYWINPAGGSAYQAYCDQETEGGGWTLVYSYTFTNYPNFNDGSNAVTPRPSWPANGDIPESKTTPLSETQWGAMDFALWKHIGHEFMVKSNINHWIACTEETGSLVEYSDGTLNCKVIKNIGSVCHDVAPDEIRVLPKEANYNYGPRLYNSKSFSWFKTYYYWESSTQSGTWPTHDPCGRNSLSQVKNVPNPHGNIFIR